MKILTAAECGAWLKRKGVSRRHLPPCAAHWTIAWPEDVVRLESFASGVAAASSWHGGGLMLRPAGMPREHAFVQLREVHADCGKAVERAELVAGPGYVFEGPTGRDAPLVKRLLLVLMTGYLEGRLVSRTGRFMAVFGCGVIDFYSSDKSLSAKIRAVQATLGIPSR